MADVYLAVDMGSNREDVAIKLFKDAFHDQELANIAFSRELRSLQELNAHPHILSVRDFGTDASTGRKYIALPWIDSDLRETLQATSFEGWDDYYERVGAKLLDALSYAYSRDIIHRDIKPENILLDKEGTPFVADFGISKFKKYYQSGKTLAHLGTPPYQPREALRGEYEDTRDVHAFGALSVAAVTGTNLHDYEELNKALTDFDAPEGILEIVQRCVSDEASERPANVVHLYDEIESIQRRRRAEWEPAIVLNMRVTRKVSDRLLLLLDVGARTAVEKYIYDDLCDTCGVARWRAGGDKNDDRSTQTSVALYSAENTYQAVVDDRDQDHMALVNFWKSSPDIAEQRREAAWTPRLDIRLSRPSNVDTGRDQIKHFLFGLEAFESDEAVRLAGQRRQAIFDRWNALLRIQKNLQTENERPHRFISVRRDGNRYTFELEESPEEDLTEQPWMVQLDEQRSLSGDVESVDDTTLTLYASASVQGELPRKGQLIYDTRRAHLALDRQKASLDAIRFGRALRSTIGDLLASPDKARIPMHAQPVEIFQQDLDGPKREAVAKSLASPDFLVVEGPPGTGKTKFITETVLQHIKRDSNSRILLTSQTHSALDNAMERIRELGSVYDIPMRLVRIGWRQDPRISEKVRDLLLENCVGEWLAEVRARSEEFLEDWARDRNVNKEDVHIAMALSRLHVALHAEKIVVTARDHVITELETARKKEDELQDDKNAGDTYRTARQRARELAGEVREFDVRLELANAEVREARKAVERFEEVGKELITFDVTDLPDWEEEFLGGAPEGRQLRRLISLSEDWHAQFGSTTDFHGVFSASANVVAVTCVGLARRLAEYLQFDLCIVDEASKATPPEALVPLSLSRKWIIVGDPKQLPPYQGELPYRPDLLGRYDLRVEDLKYTLLDHLLMGLPKECTTLLTHQHRMIKAIGDLVSHCFYDGKLYTSEDRSDRFVQEYLAMPRPVTWYTTSGLPSSRESRVGRSCKNFAEVAIISKLVDRLGFAAGQAGRNISVVLLSGYGPQVAEFRRMLARKGDSLDGVDVSCQTVDSYQGREADVVVYSVTRSNEERRIGFLRERQRLNVALSRGRLGLAIVGDSQFCMSVVGENPFRDVIQYIENFPEDCVLADASI